MIPSTPQTIEARIEHNRSLLCNFCTEILDSFLAAASMDNLPPGFLLLCKALQDKVLEKFPSCRFRPMAGFLFLRLICPSIMTGDQFGLAQKNTQIVKASDQPIKSFCAGC